jgi:hypothetical protein
VIPVDHLEQAVGGILSNDDDTGRRRRIETQPEQVDVEDELARLKVALFGYEDAPGRLGLMEAEMKALNRKIDLGLQTQAREYRGGFAAQSKLTADHDVRLRARELFDHELKTTVRTAAATASAIVTAVVFVLFVGLPRLVDWISHLSK